MGQDVFKGSTLHVTRYVGPTDEGPDRTRWQFTVPATLGYAVLRRQDVLRLIVALSLEFVTAASVIAIRAMVSQEEEADL